MTVVQRASRVSETEFFQALVASLGALIGPFFLWLVEWFFPYPAFFEEVFKAGLVYTILPIANTRSKLTLSIGFAFLFTISETVLYSFQFFSLDSLTPLFVRILATGILHALTMTIMVAAATLSPKFFFVGVLGAILLHFAYNLTMLPVFL